MPGVLSPSDTGVVNAVLALRSARELVEADDEAVALAEREADDPVVDGPLAAWLYPRWWACFTPSAEADRAMGGQLEVARRSAAGVEAGFLVLASDARRLVAARVSAGAGAAPVRSTPDAVVASSRPGMPARPGDLVTLVGGTGGPDPEGAWWWAHSGNGVASGHLARIYLHVRPEAAARAVATTIRFADAVGVTVSLKCPARWSGFRRRDAMVVYLDRDDLPRWEEGAGSWLDGLAPLVEPECPPLTRRLAAGVATAQDPGDGLSYGQLRCAQVAALVGRLGRDRVPAAALSTRTAVTLLAAVGIDAERPEEVEP